MEVRAAAAACVAAVLLAACSAEAGTPAPAGSAAASPAGRVVAVIGHSGATGANSDPAHPGGDARENSWATGTNPAVDSVYLRLAARDPAYTGNARNHAVDGATVDDLVHQAAVLGAVQPPPDIVLVQTVDNDIRCDGTDPDNYAAFGATLKTALEKVATAAPRAQIYVVSVAGTVASAADSISRTPGLAGQNAGNGPCDLIDWVGKVRPAGVAYLQDVVDHYDEQQAAACAAVPTCRFDNGALGDMVVVPADLSDDGHPSIEGHRRTAEVVWRAFFA
jgi:hypothetical protein